MARSLFVRAFALVRKYPILALPVLIADLLGFAAQRIQRALFQPLLDWLLTDRDSVLGTTRSHFILTPANAPKAELIFVPLALGCYFLIACLYAAALLTTYVMVEAIAKDQAPRLQLSAAILSKSKWRVLLFSACLIGLCWVAFRVGSSLLFVFMKFPWPASWSGADIGYLIAFLFAAPMFYFGAPKALKLLYPIGTSTPQGVNRLAGLAGVVTLVLQYMLALLIRHAPAIVFEQTTVIGFLLREAISSLIGAMSYILFFVSLSLLSGGDEWMAESRVPQEAGAD